MSNKRPTVADVRANKGKYQYTMMRTGGPSSNGTETPIQRFSVRQDDLSVASRLPVLSHYRPSVERIKNASVWANIDHFRRFSICAHVPLASIALRRRRGLHSLAASADLRASSRGTEAKGQVQIGEHGICAPTSQVIPNGH